MCAHGVEFRRGPPAGHDAQSLVELRPEPGLDRIRVRRRDHKHLLVRAGPEDGHRDRSPGVQQIIEADAQVVTMSRPPARGEPDTAG
jgi:hypothetical protein